MNSFPTCESRRTIQGNVNMKLSGPQLHNMYNPLIAANLLVNVILMTLGSSNDYMDFTYGRTDERLLQP